ncbi:MAG TPA: NUDIX hydrolase [Xanthobacteraceae bacterium]|nr:NUDIX hydrolase [Xanthobacteraceae bacterium]
MTDPRAYPDRPFLAASAMVLREGRLLLVRRARPPAHGLFTFPGGVVEIGETVEEALIREVAEETGLTVEPLALAGHRDVIVRDEAGRVHRHFVIVAFLTKWIAGEPVLNEELAEYRWVAPEDVASLPVTEGLPDIVTAALRHLPA